jgi:hypothetical protein
MVASVFGGGFSGWNVIIDDQIAESWVNFDMLTLLQQLGALSAMLAPR